MADVQAVMGRWFGRVSEVEETAQAAPWSERSVEREGRMSYPGDWVRSIDSRPAAAAS